MRAGDLTVVLSVAAAVAGCARTPAVELHGALAPPGAAVRLGGGSEADYARGLLAAAGYRPVGPDEAADYVGEMALAERPAGVGVLGPAAETEEAWIAPAWPRRPWSGGRSDYSLALAAADARTGAPVFALRAQHRMKAGRREAAGEKMAAALAERLVMDRAAERPGSEGSD